MPRVASIIVYLAISAVVLSACSAHDQPPAAIAAAAVAPEVGVPDSIASPTRPPVVVVATSPPTGTPLPTQTSLPSATPTATATATPIPTATPDRTIACSQRVPTDDLLTIVTLTYGLSRDYAPSDLVPLADYVSGDVTLGYPTEIRRVMAEPLAEMIAEMQAAGLQPRIISGYRSYSAQAIAREKWLEKEPERVNILSAPPGFSEHQLGTVVDFGSPELPEIVGQEDIEFHTWFYKTSEGIWLLDNAHRFGFTLSYSREAQATTGFFYEPWHFRYVGVELATQLKETGRSLTEYQLATEPPPCVPDNP